MTIITAAVLALAVQTQPAFEIKTDYDRFEDYTKLLLDLGPLQNAGGASAQLGMNVSASFYGKEVGPKGILFIIVYVRSTRGANETGHQEANFLIDGEPLRIRPSLTHGILGLSVPLEFSPETFLMVVNGKRVEGRAFDREFVLSEGQMQALREFASRLAPATTRPE